MHALLSSCIFVRSVNLFQTSRRTTRRPQAAGGATPPAIPFSARVPGVSGSWPATRPPTALTSNTQQAPPHPSVYQHPFQPPHAQANNALPIHPLSHTPGPDDPPTSAAALLQAIAGINGIIDGQSETQPEIEGEVDADEHESESEQEIEPARVSVLGEEDAEGETVEERDSREPPEGDGSQPPILKDQTQSSETPQANIAENDQGVDEELRSALFLLADQLRAAAAMAQS